MKEYPILSIIFLIICYFLFSIKVTEKLYQFAVKYFIILLNRIFYDGYNVDLQRPVTNITQFFLSKWMIFLLLQILLNVSLNIICFQTNSLFLFWFLYANINFCILGLVLTIWNPFPGLKILFEKIAGTKVEEINTSSILFDLLYCCTLERSEALFRIKRKRLELKRVKKELKNEFMNGINELVYLNQIIIIIFFIIFIISYSNIINLGGNIGLIKLEGMDDFSFINSFYFTITIFSTVGFGDIHIHANENLILTKILIISIILSTIMIVAILLSFYQSIFKYKFLNNFRMLHENYDNLILLCNKFYDIIKYKRLANEINNLEDKYKNESNSFLFEEIKKGSR